MLVRSLRTSHACNFQDMSKNKSARPTTSRKAGYSPEDGVFTEVKRDAPF